MPPKVYSTKQLAEFLGVPYADVLLWTRLGGIPAMKVRGRYFYVLGRVLEAMTKVEEEAVPDTAEAVACL